MGYVGWVLVVCGLGSVELMATRGYLGGGVLGMGVGSYGWCKRVLLFAQ